MTSKTDAEKLGGDTKPTPKKAAAKKTTAKRSTKAVADSAPKKPTPKRGPGRPPNPKVDQLVSESLTQLGGAVYVFGVASNNPRLAYDGNVIVFNADAVGAAMKDLTDNNPKMAAAIERMFTTGKNARALMTIAGVAVPILANHGAIPVGAVPLVAPQLVEAHGLPEPVQRQPRPAKSRAPQPEAEPAAAQPDGNRAGFGPIDDPDGPSPQQVEAAERLREFVAANQQRTDAEAAELLDADGNPSGAAGLPT